MKYPASMRADAEVTRNEWLAWCVYWFRIRTPTSEWADLGRRIQGQAASMRLAHMRVYRGLWLTPSKVSYTLQPGMTYRIDRLTSTSPDESTAVSFLSRPGWNDKRPVLLVFENPRGVVGVQVPLEDLPAEVVLPIGATYRVIASAEQPSGVLRVSLLARGRLHNSRGGELLRAARTATSFSEPRNGRSINDENQTSPRSR